MGGGGVGGWGAHYTWHVCHVCVHVVVVQFRSWGVYLVVPIAVCVGACVHVHACVCGLLGQQGRAAAAAAAGPPHGAVAP